MKIPKKILVAGILAMALVTCPIFEWGTIPVHASESSGAIAIESYSETGNQNCEVTVDIGSNFTVTIPKKITLSGADGLCTYDVVVKGSISADEKIKVVPDASFNLLSSGKTDVATTVSQTKTYFDYADACKKDTSSNQVGTTAQGSVTAGKLSAGIWTGKFNFNISLFEGLEAGLYDAEGVMLCTWEESGIDVATNYSSSSDDENYYQTSPTSPYYVLTKNYSTATKVVIPSGVTSIEDFAFYACSGLTSVTIPDGVTTIGSAAFQGCESLTSVIIPDSVTTISGWAFSDCSGLTSVTIGDGVTFVGNNAFRQCTGLTSVTIPDSVTTIGIGAFMNCTGLTSVTIPESVTTIREGAFMNCTGLTSVTIPDGVTTIGSSAFYNVPHIYYNGSATGSPWGEKAIN